MEPYLLTFTIPKTDIFSAVSEASQKVRAYQDSTKLKSKHKWKIYLKEISTLGETHTLSYLATQEPIYTLYKEGC